MKLASSFRTIVLRRVGAMPSGAGKKTQNGVLIVWFGMLAAILVISSQLARSGPPEQANGIAVAAFTLFSASAAVGAALGFLFGLPRSRLTDQMLEGAGAGSADPAGAERHARASRYLANSNLIKVSDWLTTIIIGLALINVGEVGPVVSRLHGFLSEPLGGAAYSGMIGVSIVIAGSVLSFVLIYTWTSIRLRELLEESENQFDLGERASERSGS